jgi:hypothetical protein
VATAYIQADDSYVAAKIFPIVPVQHQANKYFTYTKGDFFRDQAQKRADTDESAGGGFNLGNASYSADVWAFHKDIGDQVRRNADPAVDIEVATTRFIMQTLMIRRDRQFASTYLTTGVWGTDITGVASGPSASQTVYWNDDGNGDPFTDLATAQTTILTNTGYMPNKLLLGWPVYQALRKHPLVIDRIKYTQAAYAGTVTPQLMAGAFDIDEVVISKAVVNTAAEGATDSFSLIAGKNALLVYAPPSPGLMVPSAGYIFSWDGFTGMSNMGVRTASIPMPWRGAGTVRVESEMAYAMNVVGSDLGYYFSGIVS